jgi:hypothetical protein
VREEDDDASVSNTFSGPSFWLLDCAGARESMMHWWEIAPSSTADRGSIQDRDVYCNAQLVGKNLSRQKIINMMTTFVTRLTPDPFLRALPIFAALLFVCDSVTTLSLERPCWQQSMAL